MSCYLCKSDKYCKRAGSVRDNSNLDILECGNCGLVYLSSLDHIQDEHYEESGMHGDEAPNIDNWLKETEFDDKRRYDFVKEKITIKDIDYYYSNAIARASKTMSECKIAKVNLKSTGTEG